MTVKSHTKHLEILNMRNTLEWFIFPISILVIHISYGTYQYVVIKKTETEKSLIPRYTFFYIFVAAVTMYYTSWMLGKTMTTIYDNLLYYYHITSISEYEITYSLRFLFILEALFYVFYFKNKNLYSGFRIIRLLYLLCYIIIFFLPL